MAKLEDLKRGATVKGILPDCLVTVVDVKWYGSAAVELTYKDPAGKPSVVLLYRDREPGLEIGETGCPWGFDRDGKMFRLVSEAQRINLAHLFDPLLAIHTSMVDPLPHQITAVYGEMLPRQPLRFLLADDPGAGKTIMAGLRIKELLIRGEKAVSPGDSLRLLFNKFSPCLILIDEWVAYARQLYNKSDLPAGDFDAHFTFAQTLSESAKLAGNTLLVVSVPASQNEIGGDGGQAALERLKNVLERVETSWRPANTEEGFEIVRRRLFQPITDAELFTARDTVVRAFADEYRKSPQEFPS